MNGFVFLSILQKLTLLLPMYIMPSYTLSSLYGITIWGSSVRIFLPLCILQNKFVQLATFNDTYTTVPGP